MFITSHIRVASRVMKYVDPDIKLRYRALLSLGSITPDFIMIYPQHQVEETYDRVKTMLKNIEKRNKRSMFDAWRLGVCLHYICDYFCRPHNDSTLLHGIKHYTYEWEMSKTVKYFEQLKNIECINNGKSFRELFKKEHSHYIKSLIKGQTDINDDVMKAMLLGVNLIASHRMSLGRSVA